MARKAVNVEFLFAGGCDRCAEARDALRAAAQSSDRVEWKEVDIAKNPKRAVEVGVLSTPAVAIDGELIFKSMPTASDLLKAIRARVGRA
jgi:predicted thioredoxin/glutaredoxin